MSGDIYSISLYRLSLAFIPVIFVIAVFIRWKIGVKTIIYAISRMLFQLLVVGYFLAYIFHSSRVMITMAVLSVMLATSSWIALRTVERYRKRLYFIAFFSVALGGLTTLAVIVKGVLNVHPWFNPRFLIPLGGMIFSNSMNGVSLAAERFYSELKKDIPFEEAKKTAFKASLIPITNSLFAVGLVSLPGMMTGQVLSGVSPLIAARYQIMVMLMIFGTTGISSACFLSLAEPIFVEKLKRATPEV